MAATQRLELMPVIKIATQIPFSSIDPNVVLEESLEGEVANDDTPNMLEVKSCSEFLSHVAPMGVLAGTKKLSLVLDDLARPTILTIGEDSKLYYLLHAENPVLGSELVDVTPQLGMDVIVTAFDAYEDSRKVVFIAAAIKYRSGETIIYHSSFNHRALRVSQREGKPLREALQESLEWQSVLNNEGSKEITSIVCGPSSRGHPSSPAFQMTVGTIASEKKEGFPFVVDPFLRPEAPWMLQPLPRASKRIIDMQSTTDGLLILLEQPSGQGNACNFRQFSPVSGNFLTDNRILMTTKSEPRMTLGQPLTICGFQNVEGETDLLVGGSEGLGFYNWHSNTMPSQVILREKTITQVVASESRVKRPSSDIVSKISIFTVTENGELHFVEGTRNENSDVTLRTSGLPIRKGVQLVSSQYNSIRGICELVYVVRRGNQVRHLHRDDDTSFWTDTPIMFQAAETARTFPAYVTTVTLSSQRGDPVPEGYEVELRGDPTCVLIDDCNYYLDKRGLRVPVNDLGSLTIVTPTEAGLDFPTITLGIIVNNDVQDTVELDPAARVKKNLGKFGNAKDLQNAKSSTGLLVFEGLADEKAETAASLIRGLPTMMAAIQTGQNPIHNKNTEQPVTSTHFCDSSNSSNRKPQGGDTLFNEALKIWDDFIGDCCEFLEQVSYHVALVNFSVLGRAIEFFLTISGKVIRFGVKSVRAALKTVVQGVGMVTGLDTEGFLHLFGLTDDTEDILKTQEILSRCLETMMKNAETFVVTNEKGLHQAVGDLRAELQRFIPDNRPKFNKLPGENPLGWLLDHPVTAIIRRVVGLSTTLTNSVVSGITRAWQDAMQHRFKAPDLSGIASALQEAIKEILSSGLMQVMEQLTDILQTVKGVLSNPEEAFNLLVTLLGNSAWRIFDLLSQMLFSVMSLLRKIISTIIHAAGEEWQIPGLTSLWEEFSGQRFTISNFITYCCASIMNKWFMMIYGKPPVEVLGDFSGSLTPATPEDIDIYSLAHTNSHARPPQPEQSTSNSEIKSNVDGPKPEGFCHATSTDKILSVASSDIETSDTTADISQSTNVPGFLFQDSDMQPLFILESPFEKMLDGLPAAGRMSAKRPVVRSTKEGSISHKPGDLELVKAGKARYDSAKAWTGLIGSIARCFACALEFQQLRSRTREERISGRRPDYRYGMPQLIQAICGFTQLGSRVALIMEYTKLQHLLGDSLGEQVNADHQRLVISSVISIAGSAIGSLLALVHHEGMNEAGVMMLCGATFLDIWIVRIPDGLHSTAEGFEVVSEMSASVFGVGTCVFALKHAYNYALISCALDAVGTCTAVVATSIHLIH